MARDQDSTPQCNWNQNTDQSNPADRTDPRDQAYPLEEIMKAQSVLRTAAHMQAERFPLPFIIGMLSDEIQVLHQKGWSDDEVAVLISGNSLIKVEAETLRKYYATPGQRTPRY